MRAVPPAVVLLAGLLITALPGCGGDGPTPPGDGPPAGEDPLPLLDGDGYLGFTVYGTPPSSARDRQLLGEATAAGMRAFAFWTDWPDLETAPGEVDVSDLESDLESLRQEGITPYLNITVVDIEDLNLPPDLEAPGGDRLADGVALDDPGVVARFEAVLDRVVPALVEHGGFYLGLGNEVDARFQERPGELDGYLDFVEAAREHAREIAPDLAVGVTVTGTGVVERRESFTRLREIVDVVPLNYYGVDPSDFTALAPGDAVEGLDRVLDRYGEGPVIIQELGCASAEAMGSSPGEQAACLGALLEALRTRHPGVRYASVFTLADLGPEVCDATLSFFGLDDPGLPPELRARLRGFICRVGMVRPDGTPKPAWETFLDELRARG